jgi:hypothetical protein
MLKIASVNKRQEVITEPRVWAPNGLFDAPSKAHQQTLSKFLFYILDPGFVYWTIE